MKPRSLLSYLGVLDRYIQAFQLEPKTFGLLQTLLPLVLTEESVGRIREEPEHVYSQLLTLAFGLICKLINKDESALNDFFQHLQSENVHRVVFIDPLLNESSLLITLKVLMRILKKCDPSVLDFVAVQALAKLKPYF